MVIIIEEFNLLYKHPNSNYNVYTILLGQLFVGQLSVGQLSIDLIIFTTLAPS